MKGSAQKYAGITFSPFKIFTYFQKPNHYIILDNSIINCKSKFIFSSFWEILQIVYSQKNLLNSFSKRISNKKRTIPACSSLLHTFTVFSTFSHDVTNTAAILKMISTTFDLRTAFQYLFRNPRFVFR